MGVGKRLPLLPCVQEPTPAYKGADMITPDHIKLHTRTVKAESAYMSGRVRKLAHQITRMEVSDDVGASILCRNIDYMGRSVGRRAQGAHGTTSGGVWVNGRLVMRSVQTPTSRMRDAKAHKALRVEACDRTHTRAVDGLRTWAYKSAPYRTGGWKWAKMRRVDKRKYRALLHTLDHMVANGEIPAALELLLGK